MSSGPRYKLGRLADLETRATFSPSWSDDLKLAVGFSPRISAATVGLSRAATTERNGVADATYVCFILRLLSSAKDRSQAVGLNQPLSIAMKTNRMNLIAAAALLCSTVCPAGAAEMTEQVHQQRLDQLLVTLAQTVGQGPYQATVESLNKHIAPEWYADAKLGIFIHYGLFSVPGYSGVGCWYGNNMYITKNGAFRFHEENFGAPDRFGYKDFAPHLTGSQFDADAWVSLFKEAGAGFVVPVSCFHDGFAMWNSQLTDWNAVKTGPKRDYDGLLAAAARKQGLKFGVAWHAFFRPEFFGPGRRPGTDVQPPDAGTPWSFYGPATVTREFINDGLGRLVELVDGYRPDLVWFDFDTQFVDHEDLRRFAAFYFNRAAQWNKDVAINDKHEDFFPPHAIVLDFERGKTAGMRPELWQTDTSVSWRDWSYIRNDSFKTADELVRELVDIVSKNGVLLLDIGPRPDGSIPPEPQALLRSVGAWLKVNGEAIYGTRPCWALGFGEGPHNSGGGGFSDRAVEYNAHDIRFTQKGNVVYAIAMDWPVVDDHLLVRAFSARAAVASGGISSVKLLGSKEPLDWKLRDEGLSIRLPSRRPGDTAFAFAITLSGLSVEQLDAERLNEHQVRVDLRVRNLDRKPLEQRLDIEDNQVVIGTQAVTLKGFETAVHSLVLESPATASVEKITASLPGGPVFVKRSELISPPNADTSRKFNGSTMLVGGGLGKLAKLTLSLWTKTDELRDDWTALLNTAGWGPGGMHIQYLRAGTLQASFQNAQETSINGVSTAAPGTAHGWRLITVTFDAAAGRAVIFVNGKQDAEIKLENSSPVDLDSFTLGGWTSGGRRFTGHMADVHLYDRVLGFSEIQSLAAGHPPTIGLVASWHLKQGQDQAIPDSSGHGHDLKVAP